jgi:hypothetical protein
MRTECGGWERSFVRISKCTLFGRFLNFVTTGYKSRKTCPKISPIVASRHPNYSARHGVCRRTTEKGVTVSQLPIACQLTVCVPAVDVMVTLVAVGVA